MQTLSKLSSQNPKFHDNCQLFIRDLNFFAKDGKAKMRLEGTGHQYYIGPPYFTATEVSEILAMKTTHGTIETDLQKLATKKAATYDSVCAAHDLAPIYEMALNMKWDKQTEKTQTLWQKMGGLTLREDKGSQNASKWGRKREAWQEIVMALDSNKNEPSVLVPKRFIFACYQQSTRDGLHIRRSR